MLVAIEGNILNANEWQAMKMSYKEFDGGNAEDSREFDGGNAEDFWIRSWIVQLDLSNREKTLPTNLNHLLHRITLIEQQVLSLKVNMDSKC